MTTEIPFNTVRFGPIAPNEDSVLTFPGGLVGLEALSTFVLLPHRPSSPFQWLQSLQDPAFAILLVEPSDYVPDFEPDIPEADIERLEIGEHDPYIVYTIATVPKGQPDAMTLNLAGPIVVNANTRTARQVVLNDERYSVRHLAFPERAQQAA